MNHEMVLESECEGTEEWYCPICGRRLLIEWFPWKKTVVEAGEYETIHTGSKGGLKITGADIGGKS